MAIYNMNNYQMHSSYNNAASSNDGRTPQNSNNGSSNSYYRDDSIYSTTPFGGVDNSSIFSPSHTAQQAASSISPQNRHVQFDFPPELQPASSTLSSSEGSATTKSSSDGDGGNTPGEFKYNGQAIVPYYAPHPDKMMSASYNNYHHNNSIMDNKNNHFNSSAIISHPRSVSDVATSYSSTSSHNHQHSTSSPQQKQYKIRVPRSHNPYGADAIHPKKKTMKSQRNRRTAVGTVGGMVVGGLVLGPVGVVVGAAAGGVATNRIHKARERSAQRKYEQESFQRAADKSRVHHGTFV